MVGRQTGLSKMKILCVSDHIDPLVYSISIKQRFADVELVLSAGDLPLSYYDFIMSTLNKPLLFVFGNHNLRYMPLYTGHVDALGRGRLERQGIDAYIPTGATYIGSRARREKSLLLAGLGGSLWYNGGDNQYREFQVAFRILKLIPRLLYNRLRSLVHARLQAEVPGARAHPPVHRLGSSDFPVRADRRGQCLRSCGH